MERIQPLEVKYTRLLQAQKSLQRGQHQVHPPSLSRPEKSVARGKTVSRQLFRKKAKIQNMPRRSATVISREPSEFLIIDNSTFDKLLKDSSINFEPELARRTQNLYRSDQRAISRSLGFVAHDRVLTSCLLKSWRSCVVASNFPFLKGDMVYQAGDTADCMYVVLSGKVSINKPEPWS